MKETKEILVFTEGKPLNRDDYDGLSWAIFAKVFERAEDYVKKFDKDLEIAIRLRKGTPFSTKYYLQKLYPDKYNDAKYYWILLFDVLKREDTNNVVSVFNNMAISKVVLPVMVRFDFVAGLSPVFSSEDELVKYFDKILSERETANPSTLQKSYRTDISSYVKIEYYTGNETD